MWGEQGLGQQALVQVQADHVTAGEKAHHHAQGIETQMADRQMASPPRAHADEKEEVDGREGRGQRDAWNKKERESRV